MTLQEIIDQVRYRLDNFEIPRRWVDAELVFYANEIQKVIARETKELVDTETESVCRIFTSMGVLDYALSPLIIYVLSAKLVETELMTLDVAPAPASFAENATVTGVTSAKSCRVVSCDSTVTYTVEERDGVFTLGENLGDGTNIADQGPAYPIFTDNSESPKFLTKSNADERNSPASWRSVDPAEPSGFLLDYQASHLTVYPPPDGHYVVYLSVIRYPLPLLMTIPMSDQTPEIDAAYHSAMIDGICFMAYLRNGEHTYNAKKSDIHFRMFRSAIAGKKIQTNLYRGGGQMSGPHGGFI